MTPQFPDSSSSRPVVSVLIRTMGRASLAAAVRSVAVQGLAGVEVVLANAAGRPLPLLPPQDIPVRWLEPGHPLGRAEAANLLLEAAAGRYALFLDDDDWLLEGHLPKLAAALDAAPALVAAYGDVACISGAGTPEARTVAVYAQDWDPVALQLQNFLPIHAVLFRLDAVQAPPPCRFAPELALFEDWDFWLQLARRGPMQRVPGTSAIYAIDPQAGSGHASGTELRADMLRRLGERQLARWQPAEVAGLIEHDVRQATRARALQQAGEEASRRVAALESANAELHGANTTLGGENEALRGANEALNDANQELVGELQRQEQAHAAQVQEVLGLLHAAQDHSRLQQAEIDTLGRVRLEMLADIERLNGELALVRNSLSWRVTKPLRLAKRRLEGAIDQARATAARGTRLSTNVTRAVVQDVSRHGPIGFARRVPYYLRHRQAYLGRLGGGEPAAGTRFAATPPVLRPLRLHPELLDEVADIDAKVSVVIPTLNAGAEFEWLLRKLNGQLGVREVEIVIVDSGSKDRTVAFSHAAGARVVEILPSEFSHSYARNLGASHATGDYLLFMVQDAYPIGNRWMQGMLSYLLEHAPQKLAAVSCAEYSRSDSDMMYDSMVNTHYKFLGCLEQDRLGEWTGDDHMALRSQGQLSDVSCLIPRALFDQYRYRGDYAEDLDLGIRLIKDGMRVAMLASVKTVHSHNRPAWYYLKRTFVDVIFLVGLFKDFTYPRSESLPGLVAGICAAADHIGRWLAEPADESAAPLDQQLTAWIASARSALEQAWEGQPATLGEPKLDDFLGRLATQLLPRGEAARAKAVREEARRFADMFLARLEHFNRFAAEVYGPQDALLRKEASDVVRKTFAASAGAALAFHCLDHAEGPDAERIAALRAELVAGV